MTISKTDCLLMNLDEVVNLAASSPDCRAALSMFVPSARFGEAGLEVVDGDPDEWDMEGRADLTIDVVLGELARACRVSWNLERSPDRDQVVVDNARANIVAFLSILRSPYSLTPDQVDELPSNVAEAFGIDLFELELIPFDELVLLCSGSAEVRAFFARFIPEDQFEAAGFQYQRRGEIQAEEWSSANLLELIRDAIQEGYDAARRQSAGVHSQTKRLAAYFQGVVGVDIDFAGWAQCSENWRAMAEAFGLLLEDRLNVPTAVFLQSESLKAVGLNDQNVAVFDCEGTAVGFVFSVLESNGRIEIVGEGRFKVGDDVVGSEYDAVALCQDYFSTLEYCHFFPAHFFGSVGSKYVTPEQNRGRLAGELYCELKRALGFGELTMKTDDNGSTAFGFLWIAKAGGDRLATSLGVDLDHFHLSDEPIRAFAERTARQMKNEFENDALKKRKESRA